ncbi:16356_t:CDS:2, partial [Gigaspora margarita]
MAHQLHNVYIFNDGYETLQDWSVHFNDDSLSASHNSDLQNQNSTYWRPSSNLQTLYGKFQNNILAQWPRIACVYCEKLLYPEKASWIFYNSSTTYLLQTNIPGISLSFNSNTNRIPELKVPTCTSCKKPSSRFLFPHLSPMSEEIISVLLHKRKYLFPIYLHCSLGKTPNSNPYSEYRSLIGTMNYSHNIRAHALYSGIITQNNPYFRSLANNLASNKRIHEFNNPFPGATHIPTDSNAPAFDIMLNTTHIVGFRENVQRINKM